MVQDYKTSTYKVYNVLQEEKKRIQKKLFEILNLRSNARDKYPNVFN